MLSRRPHAGVAAGHLRRALIARMRYFLDAEFNGFGGDLMSIALAPADQAAPPFYEVLPCSKPQPWVAQHILPVLGKQPAPRCAAVATLAAYLAADTQPVITADWPEDIAHLALLMLPMPGHRISLPRVMFELLELPLFDSQALSMVPHNARHDAAALRGYVLAMEVEPGNNDLGREILGPRVAR
jgi:hypothetical protein